MVTKRDTDVLIVGAGPVGLSLALILSRHGLRTTLVDRGEILAARDDPRTFALSEASCRMLTSLAAWPDEALPICQIQVVECSSKATCLLAASEQGLPALGYTVTYGQLLTALQSAVVSVQSRDQSSTALALLPQHSLTQCRAEEPYITAEFTSSEGKNRVVSAGLLVHAEGSPVQMDSAYWQRAYPQQALTFELDFEPTSRHPDANASWAWELFTADGALALLPSYNGWSAVLTTREAERWLAYDPLRFAQALADHAGFAQTPTLLSSPCAWPLRLQLRKRLTAHRQVWIGNSAQTLHPISGQGLNLGLRDALALGERLIGESHHVDSIDHLLSRFASERQVDRLTLATTTDAMVRLFATQNHPAAVLRRWGLGLFDSQPWLRKTFAQQMIWGSHRPLVHI